MENYKDMYYKLFNKMTDIEREIQQVQQETEEMYLAMGNDEVIDTNDV